MRIQDIKNELRSGQFAWPGGYPKYFITADGAALSFEAVRAEFKNVVWSYMNDCSDGWLVAGVDINWEDQELFCEHTNKPIESAY